MLPFLRRYPPHLLLDEFTANLDRDIAREIEQRMLEMTDCLTIAVTHHPEPDILRQYMKAAINS